MQFDLEATVKTSPSIKAYYSFIIEIIEVPCVTDNISNDPSLWFNETVVPIITVGETKAYTVVKNQIDFVDAN